MRGPSRITLNALSQQLRLKALRLGDALDLDGDRVHGLLEMEQPVTVDRRVRGETLGPHQKQARRDANAHEAADGDHDRGADGGEGDYIRIHGRNAGCGMREEGPATNCQPTMLLTIWRQASFLRSLALVASSAHAASAQIRADSAWKALQRLGGDAWSVWTAPAHARARDAEGVAAVMAATGVAAALDQPVQHWIATHPRAWPVAILGPLRESAHYPAYELGSGQFLLPISAALYLAGSASKSEGLRDAGLGCATAHLTAAGVRGLVFLFVQRDRPRLSPDDPFNIRLRGTRDWNKHSFFSGHIANSMGCASFLAHRFDLHLAEPVIYGYVSAIGAGRVVDGRHWLSDTVVGALFGYVVGRTISARMLARERGAAQGAAAPLTFSFSIPLD